MPVSYTHLDVYKRQVPVCSNGSETWVLVKIHLTSIQPVSYTHLDVYKRQGLSVVEALPNSADNREFTVYALIVYSSGMNNNIMLYKKPILINL